ncbi:ABC transporter permease [Tuwongella immobilis]|uniref:ABC-2 type transporter transmembrane domain-containing protein n=1 Tax=Tuwongella immobilis TaxID=692036 RepID=A0A6C2YRR5_9BACT|nr:ABC transporter permease [Tuwongella immobilis]VIP03813.1 ABC-type transport system involved in multi-copper enzyme maturation, permease component OS=Singulisphaera acidiphila (strain ATCC BAA-1392 / DSM 18658 / VKM B-2454 / MOB10) GN=Sinac_5948 PE=4 SV=1: ABC2_membrane_4 [Tuwongella immobilis]VTS04993.1 ABC-type transport system involved in multi-copper enzyme maturation, permease component OS=Singulisphaera acidiphila (strain ATCC BAA-1392 / DSM 18658 / VKM B-2454 / MOB10) GN=Sinac_5948 PE=4
MSSDLPIANPPVEPIEPTPPVAAEQGPSVMKANEPWFVRLLGTIGLMLTVVGLMVVLFNLAQGPRFISQNAGVFMLCLGLAGMLIHAVSDGDPQVRRMYGLVGVVLLGGSLLLGVIPKAGTYGAFFFPYGCATLLLSLLFLGSQARHEDDPAVSRWLGLVMLLGATVQLAVVLILAVAAPQYLPGFGLMLGMLGLAFAVATTFVWDSSSNQGFMIGRGLGLLGLIFLGYGILRSAFASTMPFLVPNGMILMALGVMFLVVALAMISDLSIVVLTRRELISFFYSPMAYLVILGVALSAWLNYFMFVQDVALRSDNGVGVPEPIVGDYIFKIMPVIFAIFVVPVLTMRLMAEESRTGTLEVLLTAPVSEWSVVLSKFLSCLMFYLFLWLPSLILLVYLFLVTGVGFDYRPVLSFMVGLVVTGATFVSMGLFCSSLTKNQIIAAVLTFFGMMVMLFAFFIQNMASIGATWREAAKHLSFLTIWIDSLGGRLPVRDLVLHGSVAAFWLYLTVKVIESRKWK